MIVLRGIGNSKAKRNKLEKSRIGKHDPLRAIVGADVKYRFVDANGEYATGELGHVECALGIDLCVGERSTPFPERPQLDAHAGGGNAARNVDDVNR